MNALEIPRCENCSGIAAEKKGTSMEFPELTTLARQMAKKTVGKRISQIEEGIPNA